MPPALSVSAPAADAYNQQYTPAPSYPGGQLPRQPEPNDVMRQFMELLQGRSAARNQRDVRRALLCVASPRRPVTAKLLAEKGFQVYLAENCKQAVDRMKEEQMQVLLLDTEFALEENGFAVMMKEVQRMRPATRRRLLLVKLAPDVRTQDHHSAFLQSVNLLVNTAELNLLAEALERITRHHNELYREFFEATGVAAL
jgi:CheY-like chemotaxis protein